jgi:hypothetical protein
MASAREMQEEKRIAGLQCCENVQRSGRAVKYFDRSLVLLCTIFNEKKQI